MRLLAARGAWAAQYNTNDRAEAEKILFARARTVDELGQYVILADERMIR